MRNTSTLCKNKNKNTSPVKPKWYEVNKLQNNLKALLSFRKRVIRGKSRLPFNKQNLLRLRKSFHKILVLCFDSISGFRGRLRITNNFFQFILKMLDNHGATFTIKWLKACTVALQKYIGQDRVSSLRDIEPNLPLPRVINGCPRIINKSDRLEIRKGNVKLIRYWHSLFSIYRVLLIPGKLKLNTITDAFSGNEDFLNHMSFVAEGWRWPKKQWEIALGSSLAPTTFHISNKASPSQVHSWEGLLTDIHLLMNHPEGETILLNLRKYLGAIEAKWNVSAFKEKLNNGYTITRALHEKALTAKASMRSPFGQFAIKHEAAGKIRVFALVDSVSQSLMKPLHVALFNILRSLPNDGTFDQDAAVSRCSEKAIKYGCAFSFDLSAATDRLPVRLTASILNSLFQLKFGSEWAKFMTERPFYFSEATTKELKLDSSGPYYYSVGQPMGCLSSWAGLAITHHWVMQFAAYSTSQSYLSGLPITWEDRYEVLGDDIVIFDKPLADSYCAIMKELGLEINFSKSVLSKSLPVFEFAKRTVWGDKLVSGITFSQLWSCNTLSSTVSNTYNWCRLGYIQSPSSIAKVLSGFKKTWNNFRVGVASLGLFNLFRSYSDDIKLSRVLSSIVDPRKGVVWLIEEADLAPPWYSILSQISQLLKKQPLTNFSRYEDRLEWVDEGEPVIVAGILQTALFKIKGLSANYLDRVGRSSLKLIKGIDLQETYTRPADHSDGAPVATYATLFIAEQMGKTGNDLVKAAVAGWLEHAIIDDRKDLDPYELEDFVNTRLTYHAKTQMVTWDEALDILDKVEFLEYKYTLDSKTTNVYDTQLNSLLADVAKVYLGRIPNYWDKYSPNMDLLK